jgi:hypothetical protein
VRSSSAFGSLPYSAMRTDSPRIFLSRSNARLPQRFFLWRDSGHAQALPCWDSNPQPWVPEVTQAFTTTSLFLTRPTLKLKLRPRSLQAAPCSYTFHCFISSVLLSWPPESERTLLPVPKPTTIHQIGNRRLSLREQQTPTVYGESNPSLTACPEVPVNYAVPGIPSRQTNLL